MSNIYNFYLLIIFQYSYKKIRRLRSWGCWCCQGQRRVHSSQGLTLNLSAPAIKMTAFSTQVISVECLPQIASPYLPRSRDDPLSTTEWDIFVTCPSLFWGWYRVASDSESPPLESGRGLWKKGKMRDRERRSETLFVWLVVTSALWLREQKTLSSKHIKIKKHRKEQRWGMKGESERPSKPFIKLSCLSYILIISAVVSLFFKLKVDWVNTCNLHPKEHKLIIY